MSNRVREVPFYVLQRRAHRLRQQCRRRSTASAGPPMSAAEFAYRVGAAARRPASWWQLLKFGLVGGSGYLINLGVFALLSGNLGVHHIARRGRRLLRRRQQQLLLEPPLDLRRRRRSRRLPGCALLHRQRRRAADQPGRARVAGRRGRRLATSPPRRSPLRSRCPSTSSATSSGPSPSVRRWSPPPGR